MNIFNAEKKLLFWLFLCGAFGRTTSFAFGRFIPSFFVCCSLKSEQENDPEAGPSPVEQPGLDIRVQLEMQHWHALCNKSK